MATYPVDQGGIGSKTRVVADSGIKFVGMETGSPRGYCDYDQESFVVEIAHPWLETADRDAVWAFYETYKTELNTIATNKGNYEGYFMGRPAIAEEDGPLTLLVSRLFCTAASS